MTAQVPKRIVECFVKERDVTCVDCPAEKEGMIERMRRCSKELMGGDPTEGESGEEVWDWEGELERAKEIKGCRRGGGGLGGQGETSPHTTHNPMAKSVNRPTKSSTTVIAT